MKFNFSREESKPKFQEGKHRCVITDAGPGVSKSGNNMLTISARPSGANFTIRWYATEGAYFNKNMTNFFEAFPALGGNDNEDKFRNGETNFIEWIGEVGAAVFGYKDSGYLEIKRWLSPEEAKGLPEFEGDIPEKQTVNNPFDDEDIPF